MANKENKTFLDKISFDFGKIMLGKILLYGVFLILGVIIYLNPKITLSTVGVIMGIYFMLLGLYDIYEFLMRKENPIFNLKAYVGVIAIIMGLFTIINPFHMVKILTFALGIYLSIVALVKILEAFKFKKYGFDGWVLMLVISILLLIFGIFIAINPMAAMDLAMASGIFIILASILEIANLLMLYTRAKDIIKLMK